MLFVTIMHHYLLWHYSNAFKEILHVWKNFVWFTINFFSLPQLFHSLFSPWKRITEDRGQTFNLEDLAGFIIVNFISRLIGAILRCLIIIVGLVSLLLLCLGLILIYVFWVTAPIVILGCIYYGLILLLK